MRRLKLRNQAWYRPVLPGLVACLCVFGSPSCGSWSGNPPSSKIQTGTTTPVEKQGTVEIVIQGTGTTLRILDKTLAVTDKNGKSAGQIVLGSVQLVMSDIVVRRDRSDTGTGPRLAGPFVLDLLTNSISPKPEKLTLPEGEYKDISLQLYKQSGGSVQLVGTYVAANDKTSNLKITLDADDSISLMKDAQAKVIQVTAGSNQQIALTFQMDKWFNFSGKDADFAAAAGQDIVIDASAAGDNKKLRDAFLSNVKAAADFDKVNGIPDNKDKGDNKSPDKDNDRDNDKDDRRDGDGRR
ncbi:hypothetical protein [Oligoflexus tunisiensis]|uniref:hypothetical protein n=1 Tax=Oligoflexus tunisiensis TaxID=708132 RepID=UPI00114D2F0A|nr:hypothetical protein [Oligoflexus tunisiensis]